MTPFRGILGGGAGGLAGAFGAQIAAAMLNRRFDADNWLKGPYGPPFFNIALFMGLFYASIAGGLSLASVPRRPTAMGWGLAGPFLGIVLPMAVLTRAASWGHSPDSPATQAWVYAVTLIYTAAVWGTIFILGWRLSNGSPLKAGLGSVAGALIGYFVLVIITQLVSELSSGIYSPQGFLPQPTVLLDGLLGGAGMGLGIALCGRRKVEKRNDY